MLDEFERPLTDSERRRLAARISHIKRRMGMSLLVRTSLSGFIVIGILWGWTMLASNASWMFITIFWLSIGLGIFSWAYWSEWRDSAKRIRSINSAVARNIASVVRIRSEEMIEFEEHEDEGACYAFQLDDDRIVFVSGQEFYRTARFPSTDFELIDIADEAGNLAETRIVKHGEPLAPVRTIASADARDLSIPFHLSVVSGRLEDIERILTTQS